MTDLAQMARFGCVGVTAALVHLTIVSQVVPQGMPPLWANIIAFILAWQVSYYGHRTFTFRAKGGASTYCRMLATSLASLTLQELLYAWMLRTAPLDYRVSLAIVLLLAAAVTFLISRFWVFTSRKDTP